MRPLHHCWLSETSCVFLTNVYAGLRGVRRLSPQGASGRLQGSTKVPSKSFSQKVWYGQFIKKGPFSQWSYQPRLRAHGGLAAKLDEAGNRKGNQSMSAYKRRDDKFRSRISARADELRISRTKPQPQPTWARRLFLVVTWLVYQFVQGRTLHR